MGNNYQAQDRNELNLNKAWYSLREACTLKGLNLKTAYNNRRLMPNGGNYDGTIGGRYCFKRKTVLTWLQKSDEDIEKAK